MRRLAHGGVVHAEVRADGPDDHLAGVEPDPDLHIDPVGSADLLGVPAHGGLHVEGGVAGPDGVILVGQRRAEERHDPVAHHLVDGALVAVDGLHHPLEDGIEELAGLLGVAVGQELHRALEVGEEHRDLLALALEGGLRGEDLLGEVLRGVASPGWATEPGPRRSRRRPGRTGAAESVARRVVLRHRRAGECEAGAAAAAEPG